MFTSQLFNLYLYGGAVYSGCHAEKLSCRITTLRLFFFSAWLHCFFSRC